MMTGTISVYIANQHDLIREGLSALMERNGYSVAGTTGVLPEAVRGVIAGQPNVLLLDAAMLSSDGRQTLCRLRQDAERTRTLVLAERLTPEGLAQAVSGGAYGYLALNNSQQIAAAVRMAASAAQTFDLPTLRAALANSGDQFLPTADLHDLNHYDFTTAERRILALLANGLGNHAMAETLDISVNTVKTHMRHIFEKLGVRDRTQAALWASQQGLG